MPTTMPSDGLGALGAWMLLAVGMSAVVGVVLLVWGRLIHRGA